MKLNQNLVIVLLILLGIIGYTIINSKRVSDDDKEIDKLKKELLAKDSTIKVSDTNYKKLVDDTQKEKDLWALVLKDKDSLYQILKGENERLLMRQAVTIKPKDKKTVSKGEVIYIDSTKRHFAYTAKYPDDKSPFILYNSKINLVDNVVESDWKFNPIDVKILLTEKENGMWGTYVNVPEYFTVSKIDVQSLPKKEMVKSKTRKVDFLGGVGVMKVNQGEVKPTLNVGFGALGFQLNGGYGGSDTYNINLMKKF